MSLIKELDIKSIRTDGGTQPRVRLYEDTVAEYREAMEAGAKFPPVTVFHDGSNYWLADGFHRFHACLQSGRKEIPANVNQGARRDAVLYSAGANGDHGLRRTNEDKRNAVMVLLNDEEWGKWSGSEIARKCAVHNTFVNRIRKDSLKTSLSENRTYTTRHGTEATMNTGNIGKHEEAPAQAEPEHEEPKERQGQPQSRGVGVRLAHEAISVLRRIPLNDGLRQDAFSIIKDWIETNRGN